MYLHDVSRASQRIARLTEGKSLEDYRADENLQLIVERSFEIIGEALRQAFDAQPSIGARITNLRQIVDFRNSLIHGYHGVDAAIVWDVVKGHLPLLITEVSAALTEQMPGEEANPNA